MSPSLDALSLKYVLHARASRCKTLDIGCGDGLVAAAVLERGGRVLAVDTQSNFIEQVRARVSPERHPRLSTKIGSLPFIEFKKGSFAAVHVGKVFQLLTGSEIERSLNKIYQWLQPGGKVFISALSPAGPAWRSFEREYYRRRASGDRWPGFITDVSRFLPPQVNPRPREFIHLLDESVLRRELTARFIVEEATSYVLPWDEMQVCSAIVGYRRG